MNSADQVLRVAEGSSRYQWGVPSRKH